MTSKSAAELQVGDVFCREGRPETPYRVRAVQAVPIYGFYGNIFDTVQVTVDHHMTGRVTHINLSPDEQVSLLPAGEFALRSASSARPSRFRRRRTP
jgi:hypothetical protein